MGKNNAARWAIVAMVMVFAVVSAGQSWYLNAAPVQGAAEGAPKPSAAPTATPSIAELAFRGGFFMIPIFACSLVLLTFGFERYFVLRRETKSGRALIAAMREQIKDRAFTKESGSRLCEEHPGTVANMLKIGLEKFDKSPADIEKAISHTGDLEVTRLRQNLRPLNVTTMIAPLLGLIGTIQGMIQAFMVVATEKGAIGKTEKLADGIYTALVTTFAGLCVAIPGTIMYYYFVAKIERIGAEVNEFLDPYIESITEERATVVK